MCNCEPEQDYFRDTWVRYLGYSNEVGESFRVLAPLRLVRASYKLAFSYVLADTAHKSWKTFTVSDLWRDEGSRKVAIEAGDALIWQTLASVIIPGITINRICAMTHKPLAKKFPKLPAKTRSWITVAIGLMCIPIIVHPIDLGTTALMNVTYRQWVK